MPLYSEKQVPKCAWDTHNHIFEPSKFPFAPDRHFTPSVATLEDLKAFEKAIGVGHVCIAHGLSYGSDCTSLLYYLKQFNGEARGICVIDETLVTDGALDSYHAAGVRSVRLDFFKYQAMNDLEKQIALIENTAARLKKWGPNGWSVQVQQSHIKHWPRLREVAKKLPVPMVIDHMGLLKGRSMADHDAPDVITTSDFAELLGALSDGNVWIKISAPYRNSYQDFEYLDLRPMVRKMIDANPLRVVWGSDWPHTQRHQDRVDKNPADKEPFLKIDDARWIQSLSTWLSDDEWQAMWVSNPQTLYDYHVS